jgi:alkyldihydroxyacetonephosphate synthase
VIHVDEDNLVVEVQAGMTGVDLEAQLAGLGYCVGYEPGSSEFSTVGGWVATCASGMKQARYGNIEDVLMSVRVVLPTGDVLDPRTAFPRTSTSFDILPLMIGSEGSLGIVLAARLRIRPIPAVCIYGSAVFRDFEQGVAFIKALAHETDTMPANIRLLDNMQFRFGHALQPVDRSLRTRLKKVYLLHVRGFKPTQMVACTMVYEGPYDMVQQQKVRVDNMVSRFKGVVTGEDAGRTGYAQTYAIAYIRDFGTCANIMAESFEATVPWSRIHCVRASVCASIQDEHHRNGLPGRPFISCSVSQSYGAGVCMYFYIAFAYGDDVPDPSDLYTSMEARCRQTVLDNGGSLSHHHGVGRIRRQFLMQSTSTDEHALATSIRHQMDPVDIMACRNGVYH